MANKLDKLIVVDVESTCWEKASQHERMQISEIIEIGVCVLDLQTLSIGENESILVKPLQSTISEYCTQLTSLTPEMVEENGISFEDACSRMREKYQTNHRAWASWGDYDRRQFDRQCSRKEQAAIYPFGPSHMNIKNLFAVTMGLQREVGMSEALKLLKMDLEGTHHRGVDDARNIAKIARHILQITRSKLLLETPRGVMLSEN